LRDKIREAIYDEQYILRREAIHNCNTQLERLETVEGME